MNHHIGTLENKVEAQLKKIDNKCSELQKTESQVRNYLKKLSSNSRQKSEAGLCSHVSKTSDNRSHGTNSGGKENSVGEDDFSNVDYNRIIKTAMKNYPNDPVAHKKEAPPFKHTSLYPNYDDQSIIDVDAVCRFDEGKQISTGISNIDLPFRLFFVLEIFSLKSVNNNLHIE